MVRRQGTPGRQLGQATGVAILSTVASAVGLTQHVAGRTVPHLAAYHAGLVTASVIALIAAGVAQFVDDRAAAATMRRPEPSRRREAATTSTAAAHTVSAGCHDKALVAHLPGPAPGDAAWQRGLQGAGRPPGARREPLFIHNGLSGEPPQRFRARPGMRIGIVRVA